MSAKRTPSTQKLAPPAALTAATKPITKGERTRAVVLDVAKNLFVSKGYHGTSMREIADEAGLALGGIYNHFGNKEDIFVGVLMERHPFLVVMPALQSCAGSDGGRSGARCGGTHVGRTEPESRFPKSDVH